MAEWIRTSERMPEIGDDVLVVHKVHYMRKVRVACYSPAWKPLPWRDGSHGLTEATVAHWMPLPPLPKEEQKR